LGSFEKSEKHGHGSLIKYRASNDIRPLMTAGYNCTRDNFFDTVETWIAKGKEANYKAEDKTLKIRNKFVSSDLKYILKQVNMTFEQSKDKRKKRIAKS
jgi:hypothetical protein